MGKRLLFVLLSINLVSAAVGSGIGALVPVFASQLGATADQIGLFMSAAFTGFAGGVLAGGRFSDRQAYRKSILIAACSFTVISNWLMGQSENMGQLVLFSVASTFLEGIQFTMISTLAGLHASRADRGRVFGLLGTAGSLGALLSGLAGFVVLRWGYPGLFTAAALFKFLQVLLTLLVKDMAKVVVPIQQNTESRLRRSPLRNRVFLFLFFASIIAFTASGVFGLARSLGMARSGFDASAISSTVAAGGLITLPFPLLLGWLSDRIGRRPLLLLCYAAGAASLFILALSTQLWQFWAAAALQAFFNASRGIGSALVTDLVPAEILGSGLSLFSATSWIGLIFGSALTGTAIQQLGFTPAMLFFALLALLTMVLIVPTRKPAIKTAIETSS